MEAHKFSARRALTVVGDTWLFRDAGQRFRLDVTFLSRNGFRLNTSNILTAGDRIWLRIPRHGDYPGTMEWLNGQEAGGTFLFSSPFP
jgi:hypothetical protein